MKKSSKHTENICSTAIIDSMLCKKSSSEVGQGDEDTVPHLRVYLDKTRNLENCGYVQIGKDILKC